jgi:hypothetical protein
MNARTLRSERSMQTAFQSIGVGTMSNDSIDAVIEKVSDIEFLDDDDAVQLSCTHYLCIQILFT